MSFNIFACASRCAGASFSANLRVSLQAGLVHSLLRYEDSVFFCILRAIAMINDA